MCDCLNENELVSCVSSRQLTDNQNCNFREHTLGERSSQLNSDQNKLRAKIFIPDARP